MPEVTCKPDPLFLTFKSRSGSTYLASVLARHPKISLAPESKFIALLWQWAQEENIIINTPQLVSQALDVIYQEEKFIRWGLQRNELQQRIEMRLPLDLAELYRQILLMYRDKEHPGATIWGFKYGTWLLENTPVLRHLFPTCKLIHLLRDGRAVYASSKKAIHSERNVPFETDSQESALTWVRALNAFDKYNGASFMLEVQYEELIQAPEEQLRSILHFLEINDDETHIVKMLEPASDSPLVNADVVHLHPNVGRSPDLSRIDGWKEELSNKEIKAFERIAGVNLSARGYSLIFPNSIWDKIYGRCLIVADLAIRRLRRFKNTYFNFSRKGEVEKTKRFEVNLQEEV